MDPAVGGSNPLTHPIFVLKKFVAVLFFSFVGGGIEYLLFGNQLNELVIALFSVVSLILFLIYTLTKRKWITILIIFFIFSTLFFVHLKDIFLKKEKEKLIIEENSGYGEREFYILNVYGESEKNSSLLVSTANRARIKLRLYYKRKKLNLYEGEKIKAFGKLSCFNEYGHFKRTIYDLENFFPEKSCGFFVKSEMLVEKKGVFNYFYYFISKVRLDYFEFLRKNISYQKANLLSAVFLGMRRGVSNDIKREWQDSGVYHFLAISGLHIAVLSFVIFHLFKFLGINERTIYIIEIFAMIFFILFTGKMPPVLRAGFIVILYFLAKLLYRDTDLLYFVFVSGIIFLIFKPELIFELSFVLSYSMFILISYIAKDVESSFPSINKYEKTIMIIILISLFSQLWSTFFFNRVSYLSFVPNVFLSLLLPLMLGLNFMALLFFKFLPFISALIVKLSAFIMEGAEWIVKTFSSFYKRTPDLNYCFYGIYFIVVVSFFMVKKIKTKAIVFSLIIIFIVLFIFYPESKTDSLELHFIDIHTGDSILLRYPQKHNVLIDCGGSDFVGEYVISKYLFSLGIKTISAVFITHLHRDHFGGCKAVFKNFKVEKVYIYRPEDEEKVIKYLEKNNIKTPEYVKFNDEIKVGDAKFTVVYPEGERANLFSNSDSLALVFNYFGKKFLFTSDLNYDDLNKVAKSLNEKFEILKFPHHGSRKALNEKFLRAISPEITIITVGKENPWGFPHKSVVKSLKKLKTIILRNDKHGTIKILYKRINNGLYRKIQVSF